MGKLTPLPHQVASVDIATCRTPIAVARIRGGRLRAIRQRIGERDLYTCQACGRIAAHGEVDHIIPLHLGGREADANRQWLCSECHRRKSEREQHER